jgi:hypothetical protein
LIAAPCCSSDQRQFAIRFDIELIKRADEHLIGAGCDADPHFAAGFLERRAIRFDAPHDIQMIGGMQHPRLGTGHHIREFGNPPPLRQFPRGHSFCQPAQLG